MGVQLLDLLRHDLPLHLLPFSLPPNKSIGLVIVDATVGFCTSGNLAPKSHNQQILDMVKEIDRLAREFSTRNWPILGLLDGHDADKPEPPYPPHCIKGSGEEKLVNELKWLEDDKNAFVMHKNCMNGYIGGLQEDGINLIGEWVRKNSIQVLVVVGMCTDICVLDFVNTVLSARNHGILPPLEDVVVYSEGCATFDLPMETAEEGAPMHPPQAITHHMGLYMAKSRGAHVVDKINFPGSSSLL